MWQQRKTPPVAVNARSTVAGAEQGYLQIASRDIAAVPTAGPRLAGNSTGSNDRQRLARSPWLLSHVVPCPPRSSGPSSLKRCLQSPWVISTLAIMLSSRTMNRPSPTGSRFAMNGGLIWSSG